MSTVPPAANDTRREAGWDNPGQGAYLTLALLLLINLFNYIDRQLLIAVLPKIEESLEKTDKSFKSRVADGTSSEGRKNKTKLGALTTAFMVSFLIASPIFGRLAESRSRWTIVAVGVLMWSLASGATGLAELYVVMLVTRCFAGIGEAAYGPVAPAMLSDSFPIHARGRVLGWFYLAMPIGVATGYIFGGFVADAPALGWRWAFYLLVVPGLLLSLSCLRMREPPRQIHVRVRLRDWFVLARTPSYVLNTLGMTAMMFAVGGIGAWMNFYLYEREARYAWTEQAADGLRRAKSAFPESVLARMAALKNQTFGLRHEFEERLARELPAADLAQYRDDLVDASREPKLAYINAMCGLMGVIAGIIGILTGSLVADRLRRRYDGAYFLVSGWSLIASLPCFLGTLVTPLTWTWAFIFLTTFCLFFSMGPTSAILANVAHPSMRPAAFALNLFCIHAFGDAISPFIIGVIADISTLETAFVLVSLILLFGGMLWLWGTRFLRRDIELAPTRLGDNKES
jgi:MFS transporter, Spinster family, sphingosine-1-phosphate transporter